MKIAAKSPGPAWLGERPFAHRGLHGPGTPENSISAFQRALEAGYPIELDIRLSADGVPVVFHDRTLNRLAGVDAELADLPWKDLKTLNLCGTGEKIPSLEQVLELVNGRLGILIEIKTGRSPGVLAEATAHLLDSYTGPFAIMSFEAATLGWFRNHRPGFLRGQLSCRFDTSPIAPWKKFLLANYVQNLLSRPHFLGHQWQALPAWTPGMLQAVFQLPMIVWTVKSPAEAAIARKFSDNIIFEGFLARIPGGEPPRDLELEKPTRSDDRTSSA